MSLLVVMIHRLASHRALLFMSLLLLVRYLSSSTSALSISSNSTKVERSSDDNSSEAASSTPAPTPTTTLREYLLPDNGQGNDEEGLYLAMGPSFFGFYGYFGALAGIEDELYLQLGDLDDDGADADSDSGEDEDEDRTTFSSPTSLLVERKILRGVSGASAGAMAAIVLAAGIAPHRASSFVSMLGLTDIADPGGLGAFLKGDRFESAMVDFLQTLSPIAAKRNNNTSSTDINSDPSDSATQSRYHQTLHLEDALIPVAVSTVDIQPHVTHVGSSWLRSLLSPLNYIQSTYFPTAKILMHGSMARAARASACFPGLFQPVGWIDRSSTLTSSSSSSSQTSDNTSSSSNNSSNDDPATNSHIVTNDYSLLIDGGLIDWAGYNGLKEIISTTGHANFDDGRGRISQRNKTRVLNMVVGGFGTAPPGPEALSKSLGVVVDSVFSLSITGLPSCGPLTMHNGVLAIRAARMAIRDAMDRPIIATTTTADGTIGDDDHQKQQHHFVLEIDASSFVD